MESYLHGMYSFGLVETNFFREAEEEALKGLAGNSKDGWSAHSLAHVYDDTSRADEGLDFMSNNTTDWEFSNHLARHNYWHWALFHVEKGEIEAAGDLFEQQVLKRSLTSPSLFSITDSVALQYRIQYADEEAGVRLNTKHWPTMEAMCQPYLKSNVHAFSDAHLMMALVANKNFSAAEELMELALQETRLAGANVAAPLFRAILAYGREQYATAVDLLYPVRYEIIDIGYSNAQRDVFYQMLIVAAIKSKEKSHKIIAEHLIAERKAYKGNSALLDCYRNQLTKQ